MATNVPPSQLAIDRTNRVLNLWIDQVRGLPMTSALNQLGFLLIDEFEQAASEEREACVMLVERAGRTPGIDLQELAGQLRARGVPGDSRATMAPEEIEGQERVAGQQLLDLYRIEESTITLRLRPIQALAVITQIQLASRHPANSGLMRETAIGVAASLEQGVADGKPELAELLAKGWESRFDVPQEPGQGAR